jgi:Glycosyl hydrolases family 16
MSFEERFAGPELDGRVWVANYLPQWSSRAASAAAYAVDDEGLTLTVPPGHPVWCEGDHAPAIRVSGIQSGVFSGPVGSAIGQQPFDGAIVREAQDTLWGWTPRYGRLQVRARMELTRRSMAAVWMVGCEDRPDRCGEICILEVFGDALRDDGTAAVGMGVHPFRDPALEEEWDAPRVAVDVTALHDYAADWSPDGVAFSIDGEPVRTVSQSPAYPMQMMVAVFDFPQHAEAAAHEGQVPSLVVEHVRGPASSDPEE